MANRSCRTKNAGSAEFELLLVVLIHQFLVAPRGAKGTLAFVFFCVPCAFCVPCGGVLASPDQNFTATFSRSAALSVSKNWRVWKPKMPATMFMGKD